MFSVVNIFFTPNTHLHPIIGDSTTRCCMKQNLIKKLVRLFACRAYHAVARRAKAGQSKITNYAKQTQFQKG